MKQMLFLKASGVRFRVVIVVLTSIVITVESQAQGIIQSLKIDKKEYSCDTNFFVSIRSGGLFNTISLQGTVLWDTSVLTYAGIIAGTSLISLNETNVNLNNAVNGQLTFLWDDSNLTGINTPSDTALFTILFIRNGIGKGKGNIVFSNSPTQLEIITLDTSDMPQQNFDAVFTNGYVQTPNFYKFIGTGNWDNQVNWERELIPPSVLPICSEVIIDPVGSTECILNIPHTVSSGARIVVNTGKRLRILGNLNIQ